mgnify:CR=1 FL=1
MSAPPELVLLSPYRGNTGEDNIDYSEEEEHTINYGEEEEEVEDNNEEQLQEEYEEENANQAIEEEEGQEFTVAFDIQINDGSYILLIGKTEEKKLILRLVDKEDDTKPFFQNEFSLDELKEINNYFLHFTNENDAIDSIIKNLNENDKEIEILDENNIKLTVQINEEEGGTNVDFILPKLSYEIEGEEEQIDRLRNIDNGMNIQNEEEDDDMNKDGIEEVENENENENYMDNAEHEEANLEYSEENVEKNGEIPNNQQEQNMDNNIKNELIDNGDKNVLKPIIEDNNENNLDKTDKKQIPKIIEEPDKNINLNQFKYEKEDKEKEKEGEKNGEETKISRVIEELKNNLDSLGGAMNYMEQDEEEPEQEQNINENEINNNDNNKSNHKEFNLFKKEIIKMINNISEAFNEELKNQNDYFNSQQKSIKDENDKKIKELVNKLNMKDNEINNIKNNFNKVLNEKINNIQNETRKEINKLNDEIRNIKYQDNTSGKKYERNYNDAYRRNNNDLDKITNNMNSKIKDIEQKLNNMKNEINKNNKYSDNINIKSLVDRMNNFENKLKKHNETLSNNNKLVNDKKNNTDNKIMSLESKINNIEISLKERKNLYDRISSLEGKSRTLENKINILENNKKSSNNNKEIIDRINNLENIINELEAEKNETETYFQKTIDELNNNDIINKVNNLIALTNKQENDLKNLSESFNNLKKSASNTISKPKNTSKQIKEPGELYQKISISSEEQKKPTSSYSKKYKNQKQPQIDIDQDNMVTKNYRIIRQIDEDKNQEYKKYVSQTFNRGNQLTSHSLNRLNIRPENFIDNNIEYQINTRPRSRSKEHKDKKNNYESQPIQNKYKIKHNSYAHININQYENGINESNIIQEDDIEFIENKLRGLFPNVDFNYNLVYRATEDGDKASDFHKRCDKIGPNITFIKTRNGYVFGGFTVKNWEHLKRDINVNKPNLGSASRDPKAFGFSVNYQKIYENERKNEFAIWCNRNYGPTFKNNFFQIFDNSLQKGGYCSASHNSHFGGQNSDYEITGGESKFKVK